MNLIQTQFNISHKIPLSTDNQQAALHRFEFPIANSGNSEDEMDLKVSFYSLLSDGLFFGRI
jgi:hypothetical protein